MKHCSTIFKLYVRRFPCFKAQLPRLRNPIQLTGYRRKPIGTPQDLPRTAPPLRDHRPSTRKTIYVPQSFLTTTLLLGVQHVFQYENLVGPLPVSDMTTRRTMTQTYPCWVSTIKRPWHFYSTNVKRVRNTHDSMLSSFLMLCSIG